MNCNNQPMIGKKSREINVSHEIYVKKTLIFSSNKN